VLTHAEKMYEKRSKIEKKALNRREKHIVYDKYGHTFINFIIELDIHLS